MGSKRPHLDSEQRIQSRLAREVMGPAIGSAVTGLPEEQLIALSQGGGIRPARTLTSDMQRVLASATLAFGTLADKFGKLSPRGKAAVGLGAASISMLGVAYTAPGHEIQRSFSLAVNALTHGSDDDSPSTLVNANAATDYHFKLGAIRTLTTQGGDSRIVGEVAPATIGDTGVKTTVIAIAGVSGILELRDGDIQPYVVGNAQAAKAAMTFRPLGSTVVVPEADGGAVQIGVAKDGSPVVMDATSKTLSQLGFKSGPSVDPTP